MGYVLDASQSKVVDLPPGGRALVEAGPGFGKTLVACARVARLVADGVPAPSILLLSFTRTAVREMRARIRELARSGVDVAGVEIRTIDSFFWRLRTGHSETDQQASRGWGYDASIEEVTRMLASPGDSLREHLDSYQHVFVDEAQDLVGCRAELILAFLGVLPPACGYTVFLDPAQAIYGWAESAADEETGVEFAKLVDRLDPEPRLIELRKYHRAADAKLKDLVLTVREIALGRTKVRKSRCDAVRKRISVHFPFTDDSPVDVAKKLARIEGSKLVLFRTRFEALKLSGDLAGEKIPHRLRIGGFSSIVAPWIAAVLNRVPDPLFTDQQFDLAWNELAASTRWTEGWSRDDAWLALRRMGADGKTRVKASVVADRLSMASLPDDLCSREPGAGDLTVGTIHGSKGREADAVVACLPDRETKNDDEEARVLYVAVTRAKRRLLVLDAGDARWSKLKDRDRTWAGTRTGSVRVEIGRPGDLDEISCAQESIQRRLELFDGTAQPLCARAIKDRGWARIVHVIDRADEEIGALSGEDSELMQDLWKIARCAWGPAGRPGNWIGYFRWMDVSTVAVSADHPDLNRAAARYRRTRTWLAPVVAGLGVMKNPNGGRRDD